jgi:cytosine/adenosine deaminase-related metal-dependent hydrolase
MVMPGFVDIHTHPTSEPLNKGLLEERGSPKLGMSALYEFMAALRPDEEARRAAAQFAMAEMIRSGVTTFCDFTLPRRHWVADVAASGPAGLSLPGLPRSALVDHERAIRSISTGIYRRAATGSRPRWRS